MTDKKEQEAITIPPIHKNIVTLTIEGLSPLICNRFAPRKIKDISETQQGKAKGAKPPKDPQADYEASLYPKVDGHYGFPASGLKKACVDACSFIDGMTKVRARGAFYMMDDSLPIEGEPRMREDVVWLQGRTVDIRYRAEFPRWSITFKVLYCPEVITEEELINLVDRAGFHVGIGDWRPQKKGDKGMFQVKRGE